MGHFLDQVEYFEIPQEKIEKLKLDPLRFGLQNRQKHGFLPMFGHF